MLPRPLNITLVSSQPHWGGGEQWLWWLGRGLASRGCRVSWIAQANSGLAQRAEAAGEPLFVTPGRGRRAVDLWNVRKFLRKQQPDVLHLNDSHSVFWVGVASLGPSSPVRLACKHTIFPLRSPLKYRLLVERVICVSHAARQACLTAGLPEEKTWMIYTGVEPPPSSADDRPWALRTLGWPADTELITAVGNLQACKGHSYLLQAMATLKKSAPIARLVIVGEGEERAALEALIEKHQLHAHAKLVGFRTDAARWLSAADVVVQPSLSEALSLVAVEAQMLGKPLVAAAVGGLSEVIAADAAEPYAWIVNPREPEEIARGLQRALERDAVVRERCARAQAAAFERFGMDRFITQMIEQYHNLIHLRRAA